MSQVLPVIDTRHADWQERLGEIRRRLSPGGDIVSDAGKAKTREVFGQPLSAGEVVARICEAVRTRGREAVLEFTRHFDGVDLNPHRIAVGPDELRNAHAHAQPAFLQAVRQVRDRIQQFQRALMPSDILLSPGEGVTLEQRFRPLRRVGLCVPGGAAAYPSTVLMTAVPAQVAGVEDLVVVAPPTRFGANHPDVLATCHELGIRQVYRLGGAQAVAALAYGMEGLAPVDKIAGPGNLFVALAKKYVFGVVDIDAVAGPSEVAIVADESASPEMVAADLLAQAEHAPGSSLLFTCHDPLLATVPAAIESQAAALVRGELAMRSLAEFGALVRVRDLEEACELVNLMAPEHVQIVCRQPRAIADQIRCAGAVFLGPYAPVAVGDYVAGPSHVLPTGGTARWASGLSATTFLRSFSVMEYTQQALADIAPHLQLLAEREGLTGHAESVRRRLGPPAP